MFCPATARPGEPTLVQAFLYLSRDGEAERVAAIASGFDPEASARGSGTLDLPLVKGDKVGLELASASLLVVHPFTVITWRGRAVSASFEAVLPVEGPAVHIGTMTFFLHQTPVGKVVFKIRSGESSESRPSGGDVRRFRKAFVSYSSQDRAEVLKRVQVLRGIGIDYFQDVLDLEPGDRWERALYRQIDAVDLFLLFWSRSARDSEWVRKEADYALERQSLSSGGWPEIRPIPIEGPPAPLPWPELAHLHFSDKLLFLMD